MSKIYRRKIIAKISQFLNSKEIVVLHGARQVGKTFIMLYLIDEIKKKKTERKVFYFDLEIPRYLELIDSGFDQFYNYLLSGGYKENEKAYVFIDEIQYLRDPSKFLKLFHDNYSGKIKLIVSGSSSFEIKNKFKNSLVGRTVDFEIWPLDFEEFLLFKNKEYDLHSKNIPKAMEEELVVLYKEYVSYGGYPQIVLENNIEKKEVYLNQIIDTYIKKDIRDLANIRNIDKFNKLIQILSSQAGNLLNILELANTANISRQTIEEYLFILENTYIIKFISPFHKNLRSELFKTPKIYMIDHGIANLLSFKAFPKIISGNIFETAVFSDLIKNYKSSQINFWRTSAGHEIDFIFNSNDSLIPIEVKLNINKAKLGSFNIFFKEYKKEKGYIIFLDGEKKGAKNGVKYIYPWEIAGLK